jgi:hypothetical protein
MPISLLLAAMAVQTLPAPGPDRWQDFAAEGQNRLAVDPQSISRAGTHATLIIRASLQTEGAPVLGVMRYSYDCEANTVTRETGDIYGADGAFLGSVGAGDHNQAIPPNSLQSRLRALACATPGAAR